MKTTLGDPARAARHLATGQRPGAGDDLLDDLGGAHVALQAALTGGAERAGHAAAGLAGHAHGRAVGVAHEHRLDQGAVEELPQHLARGALVGLHGAQRGHQLGQQGPHQVGALPRRQVGHLLGVVDQPREVVRGELLGAEAGQALLLQQRLALGRGEVGQVPRRLLSTARLLHHQGQRLDGLSRRLGHNGPILPPAGVYGRTIGRHRDPCLSPG
jgi:hypothetical protein